MKTSKGREYKGRVYVNVKPYTTDTGGYDMKITDKKMGQFREVVREFDSLNEFFNWITSTPYNKHFSSPSDQHSTTGSKWFTGTESFDEAVGFLRNGWEKGTQDITKKLKSTGITPTFKTSTRPTYGVAGYQACVPRYLQGVPESMITRKQVSQKQKVVTLTKSVNYHGGTSIEKMIEESVKAIQIVNNIEAQGVRCNVNIILGSQKNNHKELCKIRIKSANERLSIGKLAFPLANPSMLRRLLFRYIEVADTVTRDFVSGYGTPISDYEMLGYCKNNNEYLIPAFFKKDVESIKSVDEIL